MKYVYAVVFGAGTFFSMNCGSGDSEPGAPRAESATTAAATVSVQGHEFDPPEVRIKAGQTVRWTWVSGSHDVVSGARCIADRKFASDVMGPGSVFEHTFSAPGEYPYYCDPHCGFGMVGKIVV